MAFAQVKPFRQGEAKTFTTLLCDGYAVEGAATMRAFVQIYRELAVRHPADRLLATLDDLGQACYTSGHATDKYELDDTEGYDLSGVDAAAFENGEHIGYLTTKSEFFIRRQNFLKQAAAVSFADVRGKLSWEDGANGKSFLALNAEPEAALDPVMYVQRVPVSHIAETLCAFPNGYFVDDLTPFELAAVARHFYDVHGYGLFGVGASYVGFLRGSEMAASQIEAFAMDVAQLFDEAPDDAGRRVAQVVEASPVLLLNYTGS